jgi:deoxyadenosine/deoxycytidine kinase
MNNDYKFIVIEGNIGAGKTSLTKRIAEEFNAKTIFEQFADNPFLPKFYQDSEKYSFPLELSFLADRYHQLKAELSSDMFKNFVIADYYFTKSLIFSKNTLQDDEYKLYRRLFNIIHNSLPKPDLYVYLYLSIENLQKNIQKRGRDYEKSIKNEYLEKIQSGYFSYFTQEKDRTFLIIDTNNIDFVNNPHDYKKVIDAIFNQKYEKGINRVIL